MIDACFLLLVSMLSIKLSIEPPLFLLASDCCFESFL